MDKLIVTPAEHDEEEKAEIKKEMEEDRILATNVILMDYWDSGYPVKAVKKDPNAKPLEPAQMTLTNPKLREAFLPPEQHGYFMNPASSEFSLWKVENGSQEYLEICTMALRGTDNRPECILRVQNPSMHRWFIQTIREKNPNPLHTPGALRAGFHGSGEHISVWNKILNSGIRPDLCNDVLGLQGKGTYFSRQVPTALNRSGFFFEEGTDKKDILHRAKYDGSSTIPSATEQSMNQRSRVARYNYVGLFCCHAGETVAYRRHDKHGIIWNHFLPPFAGSFGERKSSADDMPDVFCIQDWRRAYLAYILVYKTF